MIPDINRLFIVLLIACFLIGYPVNKLFSQNNSAQDWEELTEQITTDEESDEKSVENYVEELAELSKHPVNINTVSKEKLEQFPFLTDKQIENLLFYLYTSGPMKTIYELQMVEDMDRQTIQYLLPFVYVGTAEKEKEFMSLKDVLKYGRHELLTRLDVPLHRKAGYRSYPDTILQINPNKQYLGSPFYHSLRYSFHYKDRIYCGITMEKDAGEPFFSRQNKKGYDYYSFYFLARNLGKLKALALGNYRLSFGLGLVMNTDYSLGKSSSISTIAYKNAGIKKHSSTDEYNFFRGIAATYRLKGLLLTAFYSHRNVDAIVENGLITSLKKDGMHRIQRDFEKQNEASIQLAGSNLTYKSASFQLGLTAVYNVFNKMFVSELKPYNVFYPRGKRFYTIGSDYKWRSGKFSLFGETAVGKGGSVATLNVLQFVPTSGYQVILLQRHYAKDYSAWYARSVSENSEVRNENGWYLGIEAKPLRYWKLFAYADFFRFPWLKYGVDRPSSGFDGLLQVTYSPKQNLTMFGRYRYKMKDKNYRDEETGMKIVCPYIQHKFRYQLGYAPDKTLSLRTTIDVVSTHPQDVSASRGFMLFQSIAYSFQQLPLEVYVNYGFFDTDDYDSRLSTYERGLLYAFSMPVYLGKGVRSALSLKYSFNSILTAIVKISQTKYLDREELGTGLEMICGNKKADLQMQLKYKF